jgi:hypothetical protein
MDYGIHHLVVGVNEWVVLDLNTKIYNRNLVFNCPNCYNKAIELGFDEAGWSTRNPNTQVFTIPFPEDDNR